MTMDDANLRMSVVDSFSVTAEEMRHNSILTDVTIICEEKEFKAHRVILGAGSPYFRVMFTGEMRESSSSKVEIQGVTSEAMDVVLQFLYLRKLDRITDIELLKSVLAASHMLQVNHLHHHSCHEYWKRLRVDYFIEMWDFAELFGHLTVIERITTFLASRFPEVVNTKDFSLLSVDRLEKLIVVSKSHEGLSADFLANGILQWYKHNSNEENSEDDLVKLLNVVDINCLSAEYLTLLCNKEIVKTSLKVLNLLLPVATSRLCHKSKNSVVDISNQLYFFGKLEDCSVVQSFHYTKKEWSQTVQLPFMLRDTAAVVHSNEDVYFIGGKRNVSKRPTTKVDKFGLLLTSTTRNLTPMKEARCNAGAVVYDGKIYVIGGSDSGMTTFLNMDLSRMLEIYDVQTDTWKLGSSTRYFYNSPQAVELNDKIYLLNSNTCSSIECYNPIADQWSIVSSPNMLLPAGDTWVASCQGKLYTFHLKRQLKVLAYDTNSKEWQVEEADNVSHQIRGTWGVSNDGCTLPFIFALDRQNHLRKYEPKTKTWHSCGLLNAKMRLVQGIITG